MSVSHRRLLYVFAGLAAWAVVVVGRLIQVQLVRHDHYVAKAQRQQERTLALNPVRGSILDTRLRVLAESIAAESIYADPQAIANRRAVARALAKVPGLGLTARDIEAKLKGDGSFAWIALTVARPRAFAWAGVSGSAAPASRTSISARMPGWSEQT